MMPTFPTKNTFKPKKKKVPKTYLELKETLRIKLNNNSIKTQILLGVTHSKKHITAICLKSIQ